MLLLHDFELAEKIITELTAERRAVYDDLISNNMQALAEEELKRIEALNTTINVIQMHKDLMN